MCVCTEQLLATIQRLQSQTMSNNAPATSLQLQQLRQTSSRDEFIVGNELTSLLADDVQTVLKHLGSVSDVQFSHGVLYTRSPRCSARLYTVRPSRISLNWYYIW